MAGPAFAGAGLFRRTAVDLAIGAAVALFVLWVLVRGSANLPFLLMSLMAGVAVVGWTMRHRATALALVFLVLPLQQTVLAWLYANGVPKPVVRSAGFYKEAVVVGLVLCVLRDPEARRAPKGVADRAGLAFVALATFYLVLPAIISGVLGGQSSTVRFSAWRFNVMFIVLYLACRRLRWTPREMRRLENALLWVGAILALGGLWEMFDQRGYDDFLAHTVRQPRFVVDVLGGVIQNLDSVLVFNDTGNGVGVRNGSWLLNPITLGFVLVIPIAIGIRRLSTAANRTVPVLLVIAGCITVLLETLTRSAILGAFLATAVVGSLVVRGHQRRATGLVLGLVLAGMCMLPFLPGTNLASRITGAANGTDQSAQQHSERSSSAFDLALRSPLGLGLGSNPGTGVRYGTDILVTAENAYLQVSIELGWLAAVLFVLLTAATIRDAFLRAVERPASIAAGAAGAALGLSAGAYFLHVWIDFQTALLFWGFAGVATSRFPPNEAELAELEPPATAAAGSVP